MINTIVLKDIQSIYYTSSINSNFRKFMEKISREFGKTDKFPDIKTEQRTITGNTSLDLLRRGMSLNHAIKMKSSSIGKGQKLLIVCGNFGLSINNADYYNKLLSQFEDYLSSINLKIGIIRGTIDNPALFQQSITLTPSIFTIPDYTVITTNHRNLLCIGGGLTITRSWLVNHQNEDAKEYFSDELPVANEELINEICSNVELDSIATVLPPTFIGKSMLNGCEQWVAKDKALEEDELNSRMIMDDIYKSMLINKKKIKLWAYAERFNDEPVSYVNSINFYGLPNSIEIVEDCVIASDFTQVKRTRKKSKYGLQTLDRFRDQLGGQGEYEVDNRPHIGYAFNGLAHPIIQEDEGDVDIAVEHHDDVLEDEDGIFADLF